MTSCGELQRLSCCPDRTLPCDRRVLRHFDVKQSGAKFSTFGVLRHFDSKQSGAKFNSNILSRVFDDNRSAGSGKSRQTLPAALFFQNAAVKVAAPIGEVSLSGIFLLCDKSWSFWLTEHHPNASNLSEHEKCNIESLNQTTRHQNAAIDKLEDADESIQVTLSTVLGPLQCI